MTFCFGFYMDNGNQFILVADCKISNICPIDPTDKRSRPFILSGHPVTENCKKIYIVGTKYVFAHSGVAANANDLFETLKNDNLEKIFITDGELKNNPIYSDSTPVSLKDQIIIFNQKNWDLRQYNLFKKYERLGKNIYVVENIMLPSEWGNNYVTIGSGTDNFNYILKAEETKTEELKQISISRFNKYKEVKFEESEEFQSEIYSWFFKIILTISESNPSVGNPYQYPIDILIIDKAKIKHKIIKQNKQVPEHQLDYKITEADYYDA